MKTYNFILEVPISIKSKEKPDKKVLFRVISEFFSFPLTIVNPDVGALTIDKPKDLVGDSIKVEI